MTTTAETLIAKVQRRCFWPSTNAPYSDADILAIADEEIAGVIWPAIISTQGDYYVSTIDHTITNTYDRYRLPTNSYGPVRDITYVDSAGVESSLTKMDLEDIGRLAVTSSDDYQHFFDGDFVGLYPTPTATLGTLRIRYFRHPSTLALASAGTTVNVAIESSTATTFTVVTIPATFTAGAYVDVTNHGNSHQLLLDRWLLSAASSYTLTSLTAWGGSGVTSGNYVTLSGTTSIVPVPDHMLPWLIARVSAACLQGNDPQNAQIQRGIAADCEARAISISKPRSMAEPNTIVTRNSPYRRVMGGGW